MPELFLMMSMMAASDAAPIDATVHHLANDRWRVEYRFDAPVRAVKFVRRPVFRAQEWVIESEGMTLQRINDADLVVSERPFDRLIIAFPSNTEKITKDYELVDRFTDGSVILYTGHFDLYPVEPDPGGKWEAAARVEPRARPVMDYRFVPLAGERVFVPGGDDDRYSSANAGVYVYFGNLQPVESEHIVAFADPGLPEDLRGTFDRYLPQLFELYEERFSQSLEHRPTVYLSAVPVTSGYSTRGGVTGGVVQLAVEADFDDPPPSLEERLIHLIAHEAAHLWNGGRFHHRQLLGSSWLHEGSADALAERALHAIGFYDDAAMAAMATSQATRCARGLVDTRLINASDGGRFDLMYACGAVVALLTERGWSGGDLFDFWARVFDNARPDGEYTVADYLGLSWQLMGPATADRIYRLVHEHLDDPFRFLEAALREAGVDVEIGTGAASDDQSGSGKALSHLMAQDCQGGYSIYTEAEVLKIEGLPTCTLFEEGRHFPVTQIEGHSVNEGLAVDAVITDRCGTDRPVRLTLKDGSTLAVPCPQPWREDRRRIVVGK